MAVLKKDSSLPPLPGGVLPPAPESDHRLPPLDQKDSPVEDTPPGIEAHRAQKIITNPAAILGVGPLAPKKRRIMSRWEKTKHVIRPTVVDPLKVGAWGTVGFVAVGAAYGAVTSATIGAGMLGGFVMGGFMLPPVVGVVAAVGVVRSIARLVTPRSKLTVTIADRAERKRQKAVLKENGIIPAKKKRGLFR